MGKSGVLGWVAGVALILIVAGGAAQAAEKPKEMQKVPGVTGIDKKTASQMGTNDMNEVAAKAEIFNLAAQMNVFRLSAGFDTDRAIQVWASPAFRTKWEQEVAVGFKDAATKNQLPDFFSSAVVMIGRCQDGKAVTLFYNPWADGLLLISVAPGREKPVLVDFQFITGESWRKESPQTAEAFLSLYTAKEPLLKLLARKYAAVEQRFNKEYPVQAPFEFLPPSVKADASRNGDELKPMVMRLAYRQHMFSVLFSKDNTAAVGVVRDLRKLFAAPNVNELTAYLSPTQNAAMLQSVSQLPAAMLKNMSPNYFAKAADGKSCLVGLVNADTPRWFMAVRIIPGASGVKPEVTLEVFDLGLSADVLREGAKSRGQVSRAGE
jgi:hypothetical protein